MNPDYLQRLSSPLVDSPKNMKSVYCDRLIPSRYGQNLEATYSLLSTKETSPTKDSLYTYQAVLRSEILSTKSPSTELAVNEEESKSSPLVYSPGGCRSNLSKSGLAQPKNVFCFKTRRHSPCKAFSPYSLSPMSANAQKLLSGPKKSLRKIPKVPFKTLEAPAIQDDFYLNLVDWSSQNILAVGLASNVYLLNTSTSQVQMLCDVRDQGTVTSVSWAQRGNFLAVGTNKGAVQIWDVAKSEKVRDFTGHKSRVGALAWNGNLLTSGSRDRYIFNRDINESAPYAHKLIGHSQEVCGLKWSPDNQYLASGGNDNKLFVWNTQSTSPLLKFSNHVAAVKAIAWSPHERGLLASGGGTADRCIRFWNTTSGSHLYGIDTGSQVCNLAWSKNVNELVSTHGYSQNQVIIWNYSTMDPIATLTGHTMRVLYLAVSPDGQTIVTGAGDETLRFWNVFPSAKDSSPSRHSSSLFHKNTIR